MAFYWVTFLLYFVDILAYLLAPFFQQVYTDNVITRKNPEWFGPLMFFYILLFVLELGVWMSMNLLRRRHFTKMGLVSSSRFVLSILKLPMLVLDRFSSGELVARYSSITSITRTMDQFSIGLIFVVQSLISAALLMMYSWKLGLVVLVSMSLLVLVMRVTADSMKKKAKGTYSAERDVAFYPGLCDTYLNVRKGMFVVFFPGEGHAPAITNDGILKLIVKIRKPC